MKSKPLVKSALLMIGAATLLIPFQNCGSGFKAATAELGSTADAGSTATTVPAAPTNLGASASSAQEIDLTWLDNSNNESGFRIERAMNSTSPFVTTTGTFQVVNSVGAGVSMYSDVGLTPGTQYVYRVFAYNAAGNSDYTQQYSVTTPAAPTTIPTAPSTLAATATSATQITLTWNDNSNNEYGFDVERSPDGTTFTQVAIVTANQTTYTDTNLTASTMYTYRVRAENSAGNSAYTANAAATTLVAVNTASFAYINTNIIQTDCVGCHTTGNASGGYNFSTYAGVLSAVVAGNAAASPMYIQVESHAMPPGSPLQATQITDIQNWINGGAQNN